MMDQAKGAANDVVGKAQDAFGEAIGTFRDAAVTNPVATLAVVAGVAFLLGALWSRRD